jgi:cytochrome c oxidase subunit II
MSNTSLQKTFAKRNAVVAAGIIGVTVLFSACSPAADDRKVPPTENVQTEQMQMEMSEDAQGKKMPPGSSAEPAQGTDTGTTSSAGEVQIVNVEAGSYYFKPNEIRVKKGQKVKIELKSVSMMHNFVIDELDVSSPIVASGNTGTVEFVADKVGTFEYYCAIPGHRAQGQVGKLIVE